MLYSRFLPAQNQVGGSYDAFAYLGLGVLIALPIAVVAARKRLAALLRRHLGAVRGVCGADGVCGEPWGLRPTA